MVLKLSELGVNVFSIVIGAIVLVMALTWIDAISAGASYVYIDSDDEEIKYKHYYYKKLLNGFYVSSVGLLIIVFMYAYYQSKYGNNDNEPS